MAEGGQPPQQQQQPQPQLLAAGGGGAARGVKRESELEQPMPGGDSAEGGHSKRLRTEAEADGGGMQVAGRAGPGGPSPSLPHQGSVGRGGQSGPRLISSCGIRCVAGGRAAPSSASSSWGQRVPCPGLPGRAAAPGHSPARGVAAARGRGPRGAAAGSGAPDTAVLGRPGTPGRPRMGTRHWRSFRVCPCCLGCHKPRGEIPGDAWEGGEEVVGQRRAASSRSQGLPAGS